MSAFRMYPRCISAGSQQLKYFTVIEAVCLEILQQQIPELFHGGVVGQNSVGQYQAIPDAYAFVCGTSMLGFDRNSFSDVRSIRQLC